MDPEATESRRVERSTAVTDVPETMLVPEIVSPATNFAEDATERRVEPEFASVLSVVLS